MIGAIIGDVISSGIGKHNRKLKNIFLFHPFCHVTDISVTTVAVAKSICKSSYLRRHYNGLEKACLENIPAHNQTEIDTIICISPVAYFAQAIGECHNLVQTITETTNKSSQIIKASKCVASCIYLSLHNYDKDFIRDYVNENFYKLNFTLNEIKNINIDYNNPDEIVPYAIECFLEGKSFKDVIKNAISISNNTSAIITIASGISECMMTKKYYKIARHFCRRNSFLRKHIEYIEEAQRFIIRSYPNGNRFKRLDTYMFWDERIAIERMIFMVNRQLQAKYNPKTEDVTEIEFGLGLEIIKNFAQDSGKDFISKVMDFRNEYLNVETNFLFKIFFNPKIRNMGFSVIINHEVMGAMSLKNFSDETSISENIIITLIQIICGKEYHLLDVGIGCSLCSVIANPEKCDAALGEISVLKERILGETGIEIPKVYIKDLLSLEPNEFIISFNGEEKARGTINMNNVDVEFDKFHTALENVVREKFHCQDKVGGALMEIKKHPAYKYLKYIMFLKMKDMKIERFFVYLFPTPEYLQFHS